MDWDDAYANGKYIENAESYVEKWTRDADNFRIELQSQSRGLLDQSYGAHERHKYDVFFPANAHKGIFVFIHGGYWLDFDKSSWSHLAKLAVDQGYIAILPSYRLAPEVTLDQIFQDIQQFMLNISNNYHGNFTIAGHSAGGHLAAMIGCQNNDLPASVNKRIKHIIPISGLFDLTPLQKNKMNKDLQITEIIAKYLSPIHCKPILNTKFSCIVGANERPEFIRQNGLLKQAWPLADVQKIIVDGKHHFNIIEVLLDQSYGFFK